MPKIAWLKRHKPDLVHHKHDKPFPHSHSASSADHKLMQMVLPSSSTDARVVRRRAALREALQYEYEKLNWLADHSINYVVVDGAPRPRNATK